MNWLATHFVKLIAVMVAAMPRRWHLFCGKVLGWVWFYVIPIRKKVALENVRRAFPEMPEKDVQKLVLANLQNYGCGLVEFFLLPSFSKAYFDKIFVVEGKEHYDKAFAQNKGVFLLTLHIGCWELMSATAIHLDIPLHVITKRFKAKGLNEIWVKLRQEHGLKLIWEEKSTFDILRVIGKGEVIGFILDQFMGPPVAVRTQFFGHETGTAAGLALFAGRTKAPVIPVYNIRLPDGRIKIVFEPPVEYVDQGDKKQNISFNTQVYTSKIEEIVRRYPEQWLWIHRRWKAFVE